MATPREGGTATLLHDGRVLVMHVGGDAELYDPTTGSWISTGTTLGGRWGVTLIDGRVLVAGGYGSLAPPELFDPDTGSWTTTGSMVAHQNGAETVTLLLDGRVLAAGGLGAYDAKTGREDPVASAELYDPASGTWTATGSMVTPREDHMATLLPDGRVLVAGGYSERSDGSSRYMLATAELYDPATGTWTATGAMSRPLAGGTAALLRDGSVLVAKFAPVAPPCAAPRCPLDFVAELYDPVTRTWTATESTPTPHYLRYAATLLPDGLLLVAGGADSGSEGYGLLASAELYDPGTGSWTATATMTVARAAHTATLLHDGRVLVVGGQGGGTSAELYDPGTGIR
jgi:N-acetylneuraminic acid mutarotase